MALIGIAIGKSDIAELFELPVLQLLKGVVELRYAPEHIGRHADILFKQPLKSALSDMKFLLHFQQGVFGGILHNSQGSEPDQLAIGGGFGDETEHILIEQGNHFFGGAGIQQLFLQFPGFS